MKRKRKIRVRTGAAKRALRAFLFLGVWTGVVATLCALCMRIAPLLTI